MSSDVYAVIRTGGKQYRVTPGQRLVVERLDGQRGDEIAFDDVLLVRGDDGEVAVGAPTLDGASVKAEIAEQKRARKISVFKYKSKTRYRRLRGHRQQETHLRVSEISLGDRSWTWEPPAAAPDPEPEPDDPAPTDDLEAPTAAEDAEAPEAAEDALADSADSGPTNEEE